MRKTLHLLAVLLAVFVTVAPIAAFAAVAPVTSPTLDAPASPAPGAALVQLLGGGLAVGMAIKVKDIGTVAKKFVRNAVAAAGDYKEGVAQAGADWEAGARAGAENYAAGVTQAIGDKRFEKGIAQAGAGKYAKNASEKGAQRFGPGVQAAEGDFAKGAGPVLDVIRNINLPPRRPKGDPSNQQRSQVIAAALRAMRVGR